MSSMVPELDGEQGVAGIEPFCVPLLVLGMSGWCESAVGRRCGLGIV